jgi:uncharacterized protein YndB with AHSA1/START domain
MGMRLGEITSCYRVTFTRDSKHSSARLWRAITEAEEVGAWMGAKGPTDIDLRVGGTYVVGFDEDGNDRLDGIVVRVEPSRTLGYVWGTSYVEWQIEDADNGCRYTFMQNGLTDRGVDADEEGLPAGWHEFFDALEEHLDGASRTAAERDAAWIALKPRYREQLDKVVRAHIVKT